MKRALKWVGVVLLCFLLLTAAGALTFSYWFGAALGPAGKRFGISFARYERLNNGRFALTDVVRTNLFFDLRISRVEGFRPYSWYRHIKDTNRSPAFLELNGWRVVVHTNNVASGVRTNPRGVYEDWKETERYIAQAREWLPKATLLNGAVEYQNREYTFPVVTWTEGALDAGGVWPLSFVPFDLKAKLSGNAPDQVSFSMPALDLRARVQIQETNGLLNAKAVAFYKEARADINAEFGHEGFLPVNATLRAPDLQIPADLLKLDKYHDITAALSAQWNTNAYKVQLTAHAEPLAGSSMPTADIQLLARGDTNSVQIEKAQSTAPGLEVSLSNPIGLTYQGRLLSERSELHVESDLAKLPWLKMKGQFVGTLLLNRGEKFPIATLRAAGNQVEAFNVPTEHLEISGTLDWPRLADVRFSAQVGSNSTVTLSGSGDVLQRVFGPSTVRFEGLIPTNFLPAKLHVDRVMLAAQFSGSISNLAHEGEFDLRDFATPYTQPTHLEGNWKAQQITFNSLAVRARAGPAVLYLSGHGFAENGRTNFVLQQLSLSKGDDIYLQLTNEATLALTADRRIELTSLRLSGKDRQVVAAGFLKWPGEASVGLEATNVSPVLFQNFIIQPLRDLDLRRLVLAAHWSNSPLFGTLNGSGSLAQEQLQRVGADVNMELNEAGLLLTQLNLWDETGPVGVAQGFLPMSVDPRGEPRLKLSKQDRIDFELKTTTNQTFWNAIEKLAKVRLTNAAVDLVVHGRLAKPTGEIHAHADGIQLLWTNRPLPAFGPLDARIALSEQALHIREFAVRVLDQSANLTGSLPLGSNFWTQRREEIIKYALDNADLKLEAPEVNLAPFTAYLPKYLSPQGKLLANIELKPGRNVEGHIEAQAIETRPLPNIGVIQSIRAKLDVHGQQLEVRELSGVLGGERMTLSGRADLSAPSVAKGYPDVDFVIKGRNLPLARNPDVILRSDLDLRVRNGTNQIPVISGSAVLRDSFLLRDVTTLVPGRVARPSRRPPYFSIEQDPVDDWNLDVRVQGDRFMRVRSPFFEGVVSANLNVVGTAREPMALGEATINSGQIIFPFATLEVRQALVSLTADDPYLPNVFAVAAGRAFGFDVRMEAEGPADRPNIQFTSVPALSSEQIILMLTTGQIPREDFTFSTKDRVSKLAMFLGKSLLSKLHPGKPEEEKLTIRSGQDVTEQGRQTYEVEYKLSPRWSLVGEYDRFGAVNADIKWRLISR